MAFVYFIFSITQMERRLEIEKGMSSGRPKLGTVVVNGVPKEYTDIITNMDRCPGDGRVVAKGELKNMRYTKV